MGVRSLSTASIAGGTKRSKFWDQSAAYYPLAYDSIATQTVGSGGASSVTFSSVPSTYKHLQIRGIIKLSSGAATNWGIRFNSDTATNYFWHQMYADGASTGAGGYTSTSSIGNQYTDTSYYTGFVMDIHDYASVTKNKTTRTIGGVDKNGSGYVGFTSGNWNSTSAINAITILDPNGGTLAQYSHFALYGIKG
jgi:hypothetical protein